MTETSFTADETILIYRLLNSSEQEMLSAIPAVSDEAADNIRENLVLLRSARDKLRRLLVDLGLNPFDIDDFEDDDSLSDVLT